MVDAQGCVIRHRFNNIRQKAQGITPYHLGRVVDYLLDGRVGESSLDWMIWPYECFKPSAFIGD